WLEGSPSVEETTYWLGLLIDTSVPLIGISSQRAHGSLSNDGDHNIVDAVHYIKSTVWADSEGRNDVGAVCTLDGQVFTARDVQKADARPGGHIATGGHGGIIGRIAGSRVALTFKPTARHTWQSEVRLACLPSGVKVARRINGAATLAPQQIRAGNGDLLPEA